MSGTVGGASPIGGGIGGGTSASGGGNAGGKLPIGGGIGSGTSPIGGGTVVGTSFASSSIGGFGLSLPVETITVGSSPTGGFDSGP